MTSAQFRREVGRRIYARINDCGRTRSAVAMELEIPHSRLYQWCSGVSAPSLEYAQILADYFGCTIGDLCPPLEDDHE